MSAAAAWSYTAAATLWPALPRDDWDGSAGYGAPVLLLCDFKAEVKLMRDPKGEEFTAALSVFTQYAGAKVGDMLVLGDYSSSGSPVVAARVIRAIERYADTFERLADDFTLVTA